MFKFRKGCTVPYPERINEEYEINDNCIVANIGADKIENLLLDFIKIHNEPLFFILETPAMKNDETEIKLVIDSDVAYVNGEEIKLSVPACIIDSRTYTPARFVAENLGCNVDWDAQTKNVIIDR